MAPLFTGSGQQNKILEAMACGTPVITTSLVNNAIGAEPGKEILIADDLKSFLIQIDSLQDDENLLHELSENARDFVVRKYTWKKIGEKWRSLLVISIIVSKLTSIRVNQCPMLELFSSTLILLYSNTVLL